MIEVQHLVKRYGTHHAVRDISFTINEGEVVGFLGPNGAGKSTTMNILTGYLSANAGTVRINGADVLENPNAVKASIGYLPELPPLYPDMTVREYLDFVFDLKRCKLDRAEHIAEICRLVKIERVYPRQIRNLSKGYRQRVGLAQALIGNPPVLILDEPTVGLDPNQIIEVRSLIKRLGENHTVILSSHILQEIEAVCDRIIIINQGQLIADDTAVNLTRQYSSDRRLMMRIVGPAEDVYNLLSRVPGVESVETLGEKEPGAFDYAILPQADTDVRRELFNRLAGRHFTILSMKSMEMTLEDVFTSLTAGHLPTKKEA